MAELYLCDDDHKTVSDLYAVYLYFDDLLQTGTDSLARTIRP